MNVYQPQKTQQLSQNIFTTSIDQLLYLSHTKHADERGFFSEISIISQLNQYTTEEFSIKQINHAYSNPNVIRGFHGEDWNKLVHVTSGKALCVLVDIRPDSPTFLRTEIFHLGPTYHPDTYASLYIPRGVANSMCVLEGPVDYIYHVDQLYQDRDTSNDIAISLFDPDIGINWPIPEEKMIISARDRQSTTLRQKFPQAF